MYLCSLPLLIVVIEESTGIYSISGVINGWFEGTIVKKFSKTVQIIVGNLVLQAIFFQYVN